MVIFTIMTVAVMTGARFLITIFVYTMRFFETDLFIVMMMRYNSMSHQEDACQHKNQNDCYPFYHYSPGINAIIMKKPKYHLE